MAARIRWRYSPACSVVVTGGLRFGMTIALPNWRALSPTTACSTAASRKCKCQSSGWRIVRVCGESCIESSELGSISKNSYGIRFVFQGNTRYAARASHFPTHKEPVSMATTEKSARKPNAAFMKPLTPSATLAAVIGNEAVPRTEVTKRIWDYIKKNNLQDPKNRRNINADDKLRPLFGKDQVSMFELTKLVSQHLK